MTREEALEALERYHNGDVLVSKADSRYEDEYLILEDDEEYQTIKRELKALEIIKNKRVDVFELLLCISNSVYRNPLERYNSYVEGSFNTELTQEEYELLREVLENASK